jgi:hypothetical protein
MAEKGSSLPNGAIVLRRIAKGHYNGKRPPPLPLAAFLPNKNDDDGLSVSNAALTSVEHVSGPKQADVAELAVGDIREVVDSDGSKPLNVVTDPLPDDPGHALIPALNAIAYRDKVQAVRIKELALALATKVAKLIYVDGSRTPPES